MKGVIGIISFSILLLASTGLAADSKTDPREKLETAIPEGIRLLEAKDYATFLKTFVAPDDFKRITAEASLDEFVKKFSERKAADLLQALKSIKDAKPTLDPAGKKASYDLTERIGGHRTLTFVKVDKHWYITD